MTRDLRERVIIITGASSGIGAATALACARAGMNLVLNGRDDVRLDKVAADCRESGCEVVTLAGDVTESGLNERLLEVAVGLFGRFDAVFANAGYGFKKPSHEIDDDELRHIFEVNFFAANDLIRTAACRLISAGRGGHLLMCSSALAKFTLINFAAYSATKAAQNHVCRAMGVELKPHRIHVSSVHPITTRTEFFIRSASHTDANADPESVFDHVPRWLLQTPEKVADAVVRCLRRPRPEVWTSFAARLAAGVITVFPRLADKLAVRG